MTLRSYLEKNAAEIPSAAALVYYGFDKAWHTDSWQTFLADVTRTADVYGPSFNLKPQVENTAIILPNSHIWMRTYLAQTGAGVSVVPIDPKLHDAEVAYILKDSGAVVVTTDKAHLDMMRNIAANLPAVRAFCDHLHRACS